MKKKRYTYIYIIMLTLLCNSAFSQSIDQAKTMYSNGEYEEAKPVFERLVKQSPNNSSYNQWYGVCCYETGDFENAEKYLLIANKRKVQDSYKFLAKIYMQTYRFNDAAEILEELIQLQKKKKEDTTESETTLENAEKLQRMLEKTEDVQIIDSIVTDKSSFLEAYTLNNDCGELIRYGALFKGQENTESVVYINQKNDKAYYARQNEDGVYTIYSQTKLLDTWSDEKQLLEDNSSDNNYPYVLSDGVTMYFASKGNGSIGGYDIFITRYNTNNSTFLAPEQMGMPFNSPANDYMMVIDEIRNIGWFVSDRNQPEGRVCVYLFIPDASRKRIMNDDNEENINMEMLKNRAALTSIRDSWKESSDYSALIALAHTANGKKEIKKARDFTFVINDKTTYYTLTDIKNPDASKLYSEVININKQIASLEKKLEEMRSSYMQSDTSKKEKLKYSIIQSENKLYELKEKAHENEKLARNAENKILKYKKLN